MRDPEPRGAGRRDPLDGRRLEQRLSVGSLTALAGLAGSSAVLTTVGVWMDAAEPLLPVLLGCLAALLLAGRRGSLTGRPWWSVSALLVLFAGCPLTVPMVSRDVVLPILAMVCATGVIAIAVGDPRHARHWSFVAVTAWLLTVLRSGEGATWTDRALLVVVPAGFLVTVLFLGSRLVQELVRALTDGRLAREALRTRNEELEVERAHARQANQAKSRFLASMSHELRTPLNAIIGYAELIGEDSVGEVQRDAARIEQSGRHLLGLVDNILDMSRIEEGRVDLEPRPTDVAALLGELHDLVAPLAPRNGNVLIWRVADDLPVQITVDPVRVRQILINLLGNALKFTEAGEVTLSAGREGDHLRVDVEDTGPGIPADQLGRLFEPFFQAEGRPSGAEGTGLGLAITHHLVEKMGGRVAVDSTVGIGSRFTVWWPL